MTKLLILPVPRQYGKFLRCVELEGVSLAGCQLSYREQHTKLSRREAEILSVLMLWHPAPLTTQSLVELIYLDPDAEPPDAAHSVQVHVFWLQRKLRPLGLLIKSSSTLGWRIVLPPLTTKENRRG